MLSRTTENIYERDKFGYILREDRQIKAGALVLMLEGTAKYVREIGITIIKVVTPDGRVVWLNTKYLWKV